MKILFIINPKAGGTDHGPTIQALEDYVKMHGYDARFYLTCGEGDEEKIKKEIDIIKPDRIVAGGGDGTIQLVAKTLMPYELTMGIIPLGSANGLATALEIPKDPMAAIDNILKSTRIRPMDMLKFNNKHLCIHLSDIGVNALIVKKYEESGERGLLGYAKYLLSSIQETPLHHVTIRTPQETIQKEGFMMAFANAHKYGTGVQISEGSVSDGQFEICNVERVTLDDAIKAGLTILNVFVDKNMFTDVISCKRAEIIIEPEAHFQIDGEYMGMVDRLDIEIVPGALKLLV